jgi:hypothetical protein
MDIKIKNVCPICRTGYRVFSFFLFVAVILIISEALFRLLENSRMIAVSFNILKKELREEENERGSTWSPK